MRVVSVVVWSVELNSSLQCRFSAPIHTLSVKQTQVNVESFSPGFGVPGDRGQNDGIVL